MRIHMPIRCSSRHSEQHHRHGAAGRLLRGILLGYRKTHAMPLIFSYGTLQQENVQLSTFGRRLNGDSDELLRFGPSLVRIEDPQIIATTGKTHHANVTFNGNDDSGVPGMVFEITDAELASVDEYEIAFLYKRVAAMLASGKQAWVYVHAPSATEIIS